jgi:type III restriction enzyme
VSAETQAGTPETQAGSATIDQLIINSPYDEPREHWRYHRETRLFTREPERRKAGYVRASEKSRTFDDPGIFIELPLVNQIRPRVKAWREADYPGASGITKRLLHHWRDTEQRDSNRRFFFCQLEAIETLIWLTEAPASERVGIEVPSDGGPFSRLCCKMATGSGKTILMSMLIAWQVLNKVTYPQDKRFSKNILLIAPGLTVKNRLRVLVPGEPGNYYTEFQIIPPGLEDKLRQGQTCRVLIRNWHKLDWESEEQIKKKRSVDKRGPKSDEAYVRDVLEEMASAQNILVINDEAHHAWRVPPKSRIAGVSKEELNEATKWVGGLDRIQRARGILTCFDLTATPFAPTGKKSGQETLFSWIVSDFGLNDAIESGLVKTPRVVVRDDGKLGADYKSRFYHIYSDPDVKTDVNRKAEPQVPLPGLVVSGYYFLGKDWLETARAWKKAKQPTPPVMITVANTTHTAARVEYALTHKRINIEELCDPERILHIDSNVLKQAEEEDEPVQLGLGPATSAEENSDEADSGESNGPEANGDVPRKKLSKKEQAELLRRQVDTVGIKGQPGEKIQSVISVGMLSEGWDAKTVTHIMGLHNGLFRSAEDLALRVPELDRKELTSLAYIGAMNQVDGITHRRNALWQVERAGKIEGPLLRQRSEWLRDDSESLPLKRMSIEERLVADYAGTGLTTGKHPMHHRRHDLCSQGIRSAEELRRCRDGEFVRAAGCVIARQRPGTAKGFIFISMEDETGIANVIITPDLYERNRRVVTRSKFLLAEGILQNQDGVIHVKANRLASLADGNMDHRSHDFH